MIKIIVLKIKGTVSLCFYLMVYLFQILRRICEMIKIKIF